MSATARGSRHAAYRAIESTYGTPPENPAFLMFRQSNFKLSVERDQLKSAEITSSRHLINNMFGAKKVVGEIAGELSFGSHDDLLEMALMGTWAPIATKTATTLSFSATDNSISDSGNGLLTAGFAEGQVVGVTGAGTSANNKARRTIATVTAGKMTFGADGDDIETEAAGSSVTVRTVGSVLKAGTTSRSMVIERHFEDLGEMLRFSGVKVGKFGFKVAANGIVTVSFSLIGCDGVLLDIEDDKLTGATYSESANTKPMVASRAVLKEDDVTTASISEFSCDVDNGVEPEYVVGKDTSNEPTEADSNVTGSMTVLFKNTDLLTKFMAEEEDSQESIFTDPAGNVIKVYLPRISLLGAAPDVSGKGSIPLTVPFQGLLSSAAGSNIVITRIPAA